MCHWHPRGQLSIPSCRESSPHFGSQLKPLAAPFAGPIHVLARGTGNSLSGLAQDPHPQSTYVPRVPQGLFPRPNWDLPTPLSLPPPRTKGGRGVGCALTRFGSEIWNLSENFVSLGSEKSLISHDSLRCETPKIWIEIVGKISKNYAKKSKQNEN
jgi:hypothetical protein